MEGLCFTKHIPIFPISNQYCKILPLPQTHTQSLFKGFLCGEKIAKEDGLRCVGCHGKRRRKNSDWQISFDRCVQSCVESNFRHFLQSKLTAGSRLVFNKLKHSPDK